MLILVTGGSGSGKSAFAEQKAVSLAAGGELVYLATMQVYGEEGKKKVERHRQLRRGKGFETIERPVRVDRAEPGEDATVLLECMSNLMANEMFSPDPPEEKEGGGEEAWRRILRQIEVLYSKCRHLVIVTGEVFSDGAAYEEGTLDYIRQLGEVNCRLGRKAEEVWEVVYGIPLSLKKGGEQEKIRQICRQNCEIQEEQA